MPPGRGRGSRLLRFVIGAPLGLLLVAGPAELALRLIAAFHPGTRYLSTGGGDSGRPFTTLQAYLASRPEQVVPHRQWFNYWTNALGFNDEEFTVPKPTGRFRIMAVGDSFTFGLVPYPQNVMTLLSRRHSELPVRTAISTCSTSASAAPTPPTTGRLIELAFATYEPDLVLINFYAGNDGPDLYNRAREARPLRALLRHSYLWTYLRNVFVVRKSVPDAGALAASVLGPAAPAGHAAAEQPRGGQLIDPGRRLRDDAPVLVGPVFDQKVFAELLAVELGRFYVPSDARAVGQAWQRHAGADRGRPCPRGGARRPLGDHALPVGSAGGRTSPRGDGWPATEPGGATPRSGPTASILDCRIGPCSRTAVSAASSASI